jgi:transposase
MKITTIGIDLAKNVFQIHGVDSHGKAVLRRQVERSKLLNFFVKLEPCLIGMEACGSAHYWARKLTEMGHTVKLMAAQFVKAYVKSNKNDMAAAEAICEAVSRPNMRFVAIKTESQQAILALHRARQGFVKARTAQANQIRGLLLEFGKAIAQGISNIARSLPEILEDTNLPDSFRNLLQRLNEHLKKLDEQVEDLEKEIQGWHRDTEMSKKLAEIPGIGPLTASALVATIGDIKNFSNGRQLAAWLGLVPKQHSSGGKSVLLGISKRGDSYLRTLLIHGARAVVRFSDSKPATNWLNRLLARRNRNIAVVALANKNARIVWALLTHHERRFQTSYTATTAVA